MKIYLVKSGWGNVESIYKTKRSAKHHALKLCHSEHESYIDIQVWNLGHKGDREEDIRVYKGDIVK